MCMKYRAICFDFDYTLGDSTDSIVAGFQYGFTRLGWPAPDRETVRRTVGYLLEDAYTLLTGDRDPEHRAAFRPLFLEASMERQRRETTLFPGAPELLRELERRGYRGRATIELVTAYIAEPTLAARRAVERVRAMLP